MSGLSANLTDLVGFVEKYWVEKSGLVVALLLVIFIEAGLLLHAAAPWYTLSSVLILSAAFLVVFWKICRRPPKTPKNKVGFLVSIASGDDQEAQKLREDFIVPLRQLVKSGRAGHAFHFMELPQHIAQNIVDPDDAQLLRVRSRAHFLLYGRVRLRRVGGQEHHVIDIEGLVAHTPVPEPISLALSREFSELFPRKIHIPTENDLFSFQFTSQWTGIVAKYIIGIAAALSGDLDYAERLYTDALDMLKGKQSDFPVYLKLSERLPVRISELYEARAQAAFKEWFENHDPLLIDLLATHLEKIEESRRELPGSLNLAAVHAFLKKRDTDTAIAYLKKWKNPNDGIWHYNMAFLYGHKGDLRSAIRHYRHAMSYRIETEQLAQIEDFISWVLEQEPQKYQLYYCLGFIAWKTKGDNVQAQKYFADFLASGQKDEFDKERELASQWIKEIADEQLSKQA